MTRIAVIGGGIAGLAAAHRLLHPADGRPADDVVVFESDTQLGGKIRSSDFAGVPHVDEGPDAFLARVPDATAFAAEVGLGDGLTHPERVGAGVWHHELHRIPEGLVLGVPAKLAPLARTRLLSPRGKLRAALDLALPATSTASDSIGAFVRARLGDEVHERLIDALVGSIYAADTDDFSLAEVPQLAGLAGRHRSLILAGRAVANGAGTAAAADTPVFATPAAGMSELCAAAARAIQAAGGHIALGTAVDAIEPVGTGAQRRWIVHTSAADGPSLLPPPTGPATALAAPDPSSAPAQSAPFDPVHQAPFDPVQPAPFDPVQLAPFDAVHQAPFDAVILATPAAVTSRLVRDAAPEAADHLATARSSDVIMVTLRISDRWWPRRLSGMSGYLVPKPVQRDVTAVSFGSQKWAHWQPPDGGVLLRVSLGHAGNSPLHLTDEQVIERACRDVAHHLSTPIEPLDVRITRWPGAFAQYRPHHRAWVDAVTAALPSGVLAVGAAYNGIGIPACIRDARNGADRALQHADRLTQSAP